jgi:hypothetical protein
MRIKSLLTVTIIGMLMVPVTAYAELEQALINDGWDEIVFDELPPNVFTAFDDESGLSRGIQVTSEGSVSIAFLNVDIDLETTPKLEWSWQSLTPIIDSDATARGGDDRNLAIYVAFPYQPENTSLGYRFRRAAIEVLEGEDTPDRVLTYIWGGGAERGAKVENPYVMENGQIIFLRTPEDGEGIWFDESVDLRSDFIEAFGFAPVSPAFIGITSDSDDTESTVRARVRGLRFSK